MLFSRTFLYKVGIGYLKENPDAIMVFGDLVHDPKFLVVGGALATCGTVLAEGADLVKVPQDLWPGTLPHGLTGFAHPRELKRISNERFPLEGRQHILHYDEYRSNIVDHTASA